ncbi:sulfite reductase (NADPH) alpha subunit [Lentibacillus persicus]|uniref:assimilatory sulfite reductase (NADPH) n=1 Tax=Lentibacillus persicus TaxID=640948 RepID=A0A1I1W481_9BACI|nr:assimilatory sulfite reductase (NADPH) flavoprotein subunit [Lentibacillus persicus]SFD89829.1 sulfite reductase (NADPH) alpha subunit [Lentibacillus persicus]
MQLQVENSPFNQEQTDYLNHLLPTLTEAQRIWLSGFLAVPVTMEAPAAATATAALDPAEAQQNAQKPAARNVTILFGSETGNGQQVAEDMLQKLEEKDMDVTISALDDFKPKNLKKVEDLLIVTATHGEGDPPDNAVAFYETLFSRKAPKLDGVRFSVLSLGDESYEFFCQTGKDFDKRLEELGGERLYSRVDCDVDFDEDASGWIEGVFGVLRESLEVPSADESTPAAQLETTSLTADQPVYSRTNPFRAEVLENLNLNDQGSNKETRHIELSLEGSNFDFEPGDSLGIFPENDPELVDALIARMYWDPDESVPINKQGEVRSLRNALLTNFEITKLTKPLLEKAAQLFENEWLSALLKPEQEEERKAYLDGRDLLDFVTDFELGDVSPGEFVQILRKMPARLYSIASSYQANPDEVHLTIGTVAYHAHGRDRKGVCSGQCALRVEPGEQLPVYIHRNPNFKFPADAEAPVIMVGPGTGVAPYRSFLEEREEAEVNGKTWLFYGDQHFASDFLYQVDWQQWLKEGILTKMDVAFSRDTAEKVYVQHRMQEHSTELYQWITEGAYVYVCGDEKRMAKDVENALLTIFENEGQMSADEAGDYLKKMRQEKRYQRDVY